METKTVLIIFLSVVICITAASFYNSKNNTSQLKLNEYSLTLISNDNNTFLLKAYTSNNSTPVVWSSSAPTIASVDSSGLVKALSNGTSFITATSGNLSATCNVTVTSKVKSAKLNHENLILEKNEVETLTLSIEPHEAQSNKVLWSSSNTSIATVNQSGKVTALQEGTTYVTAKIGSLYPTCKVTVMSKEKNNFTQENFEYVKNLIEQSNVQKVQVAIIDNGNVTLNYAHNCSENENFYVASLSKTILGITAAKMEQDRID